MACFLKNVTRTSRTISKSLLRLANRPIRPTRQYSVYGPDDVNLPPEIPEHRELNIRLRAYDYVILESFAKYVHNISATLGIDSDTWPVPSRNSTIQTFKPKTSNTEHEHNISRYERVVQVDDVPSTLAPILLQALTQNIPEGVEMVVKEPDPEEDEFRFVPDIMLLELQEQIAELDRAREERRK